ncbi:MAG: hypothetical protein K1X75_03795 [Leptospirales bacterium]|nr:hypothetical protein [Leptospirales bacterium]
MIYSPSSRAALHQPHRTAFALFCLLALCPLRFAAAETQAALDCAGFLISLRSRSAAERQAAAAALGACPASQNVARLLEELILKDDAWVRAAAWQSLRVHRDRQTLSFLVQYYESGVLQAQEWPELIENLLQLAGPSDAAATSYIFARAAANNSVEVRRRGLEGLGRVQDRSRWPLLAEALRSTSRVERIAALQAARWMMAPEAAPDALRMLQASADEQAAAIQYLAETGGPLAVQALVDLYLRSGAERGALMQQALRELRRRSELPENVLVAQGAAALRTSPTERSPVVAALRSGAVLFLLAEKPEDYRLPGAMLQMPAAANWREVRTLDGLHGWVHGSQLAEIPAF